MPEMPHAGEHHRDARRVGRRDHLGVAQRPAGLDHRRRAGLDRRQQPVREREERVGGDDRALRSAASRRSPRPRPCAPRRARNRRGSSAPRRRRPSRRPWRRRWRSTSRACRPPRRIADRRSSAAVGARLVTTFSIDGVERAIVAILHQQAAGDRAHRQRRPRADRAARRRAAAAGSSCAATISIASSSASGAMMTSVKISTIFARRRRVELAVQRDDAAEGRDRIAGERLLVGLDQRRADRDAAGVGVLDDRDRRRLG